MKLSFVRYEINQSERFIIKVSVDESPIKPTILKYKGIPSIFMRRDGFTNGATYEEIIEMSVKSKNTQYDVLVSGTKYDASKFSALRDFYSEHNDGRELKKKALQSMPVPNGTELDGRVLSFCYYKARKVLEIAEYLGVSNSTYLRRKVLQNLEANGYLEKSKVSRAVFYKTRAEAVALR